MLGSRGLVRRARKSVISTLRRTGSVYGWYRGPRGYVLTWLLCRIAIGLRQQIIQCYT